MRCTRRLLRSLKSPAVADGGTSTTRLGDFYARVVVARPAHLVVAASERTLLPVVVAAAPYANLPARLGPAVGDVLRAIGVSPSIVADEVARMTSVVLARTESRTVLGSLNDFCRLLPYELEGGRTLLEASLRLAEAPCGPIGMESPWRATVRLLGG